MTKQERIDSLMWKIVKWEKVYELSKNPVYLEMIHNARIQLCELKHEK